MRDEAETTEHHRAHLIVVPLAIVGGVTLQLLRQAGAHSWNTVWAEDGMYAGDAVRHPLLSTPFRGYAGYAQVGTRLLAMGVRIVPAERIAEYLAFAAALATTLLALFVYRCTEDWIRHRSLRLTMAGMCVFAPVLVSENTANLTNWIWTLAFAAFWAVLAHVRRPADVAARACVALVAILSSPVTVLFVPLSVIVVVARRRVSDAVVLAALVVGGAVQGAVMLGTDRVPGSSSSLHSLVTAYGTRVLGSLLVGERGLSRMWSAAGAWVSIAAALVFAGILVAAARRSTSAQRQFTLVAVGYSVAAYAVTTVPRGVDLLEAVLVVRPPGGARYAVLPLLLAAAAVLVLVDAMDAALWRRVLVAQALVLCLFNFSMTIERSAGPTWAAALGVAKERCQREPSTDVDVAIAPLGFSMRVHCDELVS